MKSEECLVDVEESSEWVRRCPRILTLSGLGLIEFCGWCSILDFEDDLKTFPEINMND